MFHANRTTCPSDFSSTSSSSAARSRRRGGAQRNRASLRRAACEAMELRTLLSTTYLLADLASLARPRRQRNPLTHCLGGFKAPEFFLGDLERISVKVDPPLLFARQIILDVEKVAAFLETGHGKASGEGASVLASPFKFSASTIPAAKL